MDTLQTLAVQRAQSALTLALQGVQAPISHNAKAHAFVEVARAIALTGERGDLAAALSRHPNELVQKAGAHTLASPWESTDGAALAAAFVASIAEHSMLDAVARYARVLPINQRRVLLASGFTADVVAEGSPKVVRSLSMGVDADAATKCAAIIVCTKELLAATGDAGFALFQGELERAITRAMNQAVLNALPDSNTLEVPATGDALGDLRAGLRAAGPSHGYVVGAPAGVVADLATRTENRGGMSIRGGTFVPGVEVIAVDDLATMHVIPASRLALWLGGLEVRASGEADVNMADTPDAPSEVVSLWQTNCTGLIAERSFYVAGDAVQVIVSGS